MVRSIFMILRMFFTFGQIRIKAIRQNEIVIYILFFVGLPKSKWWIMELWRLFYIRISDCLPFVNHESVYSWIQKVSPKICTSSYDSIVGVWNFLENETSMCTYIPNCLLDSRYIWFNDNLPWNGTYLFLEIILRQEF